MTANWFEAKVKYVKVNEDGREKKVNEAYLVDAMSYTEAESRIMHEMESVITGDYYISALKKSNVTEVVPSEDENDDRWYKAKVAIIDADEVSGKEKSSFQYYLVAASDFRKALENLEGDFSPLYGALKGNTAVMFAQTANAPARLIKEFTKDAKKDVPVKPELKAAYVQESFYVGAEHLETLVNIKSKKELIGDVIMLLQSPAKNVISALQSSGQTIHGLLKTLEER